MSSKSREQWKGSWPQTIEEFEHFIDVNQNRMIRHAFYRLGNMNDAEDVIQELFVKAYINRKKLRSITNVTPYLYRMASNACTDLLRKRKHFEIPLDDIREETVFGDQFDASDPVSANEKQRQINELLRLLPEKQAEVIRFRVFDDLRFDEIAKVLNCSLSTVKSRFQYGIDKLRKIKTKSREVLL